MDSTCIGCDATFKRYSTIQRFCGTCSRAKASTKPQKPRKPLKRSQKPLPRSTKPIKQRGKVALKDADFRDKIVRPYLEKNFGIECANCGIMPPLLDSGEYSRHAIDHIQGKGPHPELRFVITNFQFLCVPCHEEKTGTVKWTKKDLGLVAQQLREQQAERDRRRALLTSEEVNSRIQRAMEQTLKDAA